MILCMNDPENISNISNDQLQKIVTEMYILIEFLLIYMNKKNIIDKDDFNKEMIKFYTNENNLGDDKQSETHDKFDLLKRDSIFNFTNTGEA